MFRLYYFIHHKFIICCKILIHPCLHVIRLQTRMIGFLILILSSIQIAWVWGPFVFYTFWMLIENWLLFFNHITILLDLLDHCMQICKLWFVCRLLIWHQCFYGAKFLRFNINLLFLSFLKSILIVQKWCILWASILSSAQWLFVAIICLPILESDTGSWVLTLAHENVPTRLFLRMLLMNYHLLQRFIRIIINSLKTLFEKLQYSTLLMGFLFSSCCCRVSILP